MSAPLKMSELILAVGDENVQFQNLDNSTITLDYRAGHPARVTFGTEQRFSPNGQTDRLGLVLWLPRDAVKAALDRAKAGAA